MFVTTLSFLSRFHSFTNTAKRFVLGRMTNPKAIGPLDGAIVSESPLALIGNASGQTFVRERVSIRGVFDKEVRRKPLVFAADA